MKIAKLIGRTLASSSTHPPEQFPAHRSTVKLTESPSGQMRAALQLPKRTLPYQHPQTLSTFNRLTPVTSGRSAIIELGNSERTTTSRLTRAESQTRGPAEPYKYMLIRRSRQKRTFFFHCQRHSHRPASDLWKICALCRHDGSSRSKNSIWMHKHETFKFSHVPCAWCGPHIIATRHSARPGVTVGVH